MRSREITCNCKFNSGPEINFKITGNSVKLDDFRTAVMEQLPDTAERTEILSRLEATAQPAERTRGRG